MPHVSPVSSHSFAFAYFYYPFEFLTTMPSHRQVSNRQLTRDQTRKRKIANNRYGNSSTLNNETYNTAISTSPAPSTSQSSGTSDVHTQASPQSAKYRTSQIETGNLFENEVDIEDTDLNLQATPVLCDGDITTPPRYPPKRQKLNEYTTTIAGPTRPSFNSNFQLPNDILKNLTPVSNTTVSRDNSIPTLRKQEILQNIQIKLLEKSSRISRKLLALQKKRQLNQELRLKKLNDELQQANIRRNQYLNMVRQRAAKFYRDVGDTDTRGARIIIQKSQRTNVMSMSATPNRNNRHVPKYLDINLFVPLQKLAQKFLFHKYVNMVANSQFLEKFQAFSFSKVLKFSNSDNDLKIGIHFILKYLQVPHLLGSEYKSFFYCFIMIADFNSCMNHDGNDVGDRQSVNYNHPGFNVNTDTKDEKEMFFHNCIWLIVFKFGQYLVDEFNTIIQKKSLTDKFLKYWHEYNFIFKIFKWNHYNSLKSLLISSINIVDKQIKALSHLENDILVEDLNKQRSKLKDELLLLNNYQLDDLKNFNSSNEVAAFYNSMNDFVNEIYSQTQFPSPSSHPTLRRSSSSSYLQNKSSYVCFNNYRFFIPNIIPLLDWRSYWMKRFLQIEIEQNKRQHKFPVKLKSGLLYNSNDLPQGSNGGKIEVSEVFQTDYSSITVKQIYNNLVNYYLEYTNSYYEIKERDIFILVDCDSFYLESMVHLARTYIVNDGNNGSLNDNNILLDLITRCSIDLGTEFYEDSLIELNKFVLQLYFKKCRFLDTEFERFRVFENLYILLNHCQNFPHLKFNIYTFNSSLIFPEFYKHVILKNHTLQLSQSKSIISSSLKTSIEKILISNHSLPSCNFFSTIFINEIISGCISNHELSHIYRDTFQELHSKLDHLINVNCFGIMFEFYHGERFLEIDKVHERLENHHELIMNSNFETYFNKNIDRIKRVMNEKVKLLLSNKDFDNPKITQLFKYYQSEVIHLIESIINYVTYIYKLYSPILNWIYYELGREED